MVGAVVHGRDEGAVLNAQFLDHLRNSGDVVVTAAYEGDKGLPGVLAEDANAGEVGGFLFEIRVLGGPLRVEVGEVGGEVEVVGYYAEGVVVVGEWWWWVGGGGGCRWIVGPVVEVIWILAEGEKTAV